jgi:hypothetical protein
MCELAQFCRRTCYCPIDATHEGLLMPETLPIQQPSAETPCSLMYAFVGDLPPSVRSLIEVIEWDLYSEAFQSAL